eukprot:6184221-Pleurochrysis_carterae.AAC.1
MPQRHAARSYGACHAELTTRASRHIERRCELGHGRYDVSPHLLKVASSCATNRYSGSIEGQISVACIELG